MAERDILERLEARDRRAPRRRPDGLLRRRRSTRKGLDAILKKIGEEATETVIAAEVGRARRRSCTRPPTSGSTAW